MQVKKNLNSSRGFTLIEIIIAVSILLFGVVLVYSAFSSMTALTYGVSSRFTAVYLASEGLEIVRNLRDNNFIAMASDPSNAGITWSLGLAGNPCDRGCIASYKTINTGQLALYDGEFLGLNAQGFYDYDANSTPTIFKRKITISPVEGTSDILKVNVVVLWSYNNQDFNFQADEYLYNWL